MWETGRGNVAFWLGCTGSMSDSEFWNMSYITHNLCRARLAGYDGLQRSTVGGSPGPKIALRAQRFRPEKRAQRLSFWVRRPPGGVGVFHAKGWWPKTSCPPSKLCLPWVSKRGIRDVPGILPGCPGPLAVFKKFVQKKLRAHFSFPKD